MSIVHDFGNTIRNKILSKLADFVISIVQIALTKIFPMLLTITLGHFLVKTGEQSIVDTTSIQPDGLWQFAKNFGVSTFLIAILCAVAFRSTTTMRRVSLPLIEGRGLTSLFVWIGILGFIVVFVGSYLMSTRDYAEIIENFSSAIDQQNNADIFNYVLVFISILLTSLSLYFITYSISCYWLMPPALKVLSQPTLIRWLPRALSTMEITGRPKHV